MNSIVNQLLLNRMVQGDQDALAAFYELTIEALYGEILGILKSTHDAQATVCDAYVFIWQNALLLQKDNSNVSQCLVQVALAKASEQIAARRAFEQPALGVDSERNYGLPAVAG